MFDPLPLAGTAPASAPPSPVAPASIPPAPIVSPPVAMTDATTTVFHDLVFLTFLAAFAALYVILFVVDELLKRSRREGPPPRRDEPRSDGR